jgi:hypothetical protein
MSLTTLTAIRNKVRRITRSPSINQISDADLDQYINTFILYDFPQELKLFTLRTVLVFYTQPNIDQYTTETVNPADPLYNFKNKYTAVHQPAYIAGVPIFYTQDRATFQSIWPMINSVADTQLRGNGFTGPYIGTLTTGTGAPVLQNNVIFSATDATAYSQILIDYPVSPTTGALGVPGVPQTLPSPYGQINYITGAYTLNFPTAIPAGNTIWSETIPYQTGKPIGMLYYDGIFTIRPVPDISYPVSIEADVRPTELLTASQVPDEELWWQYVAYGASIKVLQDRMDLDTVQMVMPEFIRQQDFVGRKTVNQYANDAAKTIYTEGQNKYGHAWFMSSWPY